MGAAHASAHLWQATYGKRPPRNIVLSTYVWHALAGVCQTFTTVCRDDEGCTRYQAWPLSRPSPPYNAGKEPVGFSPTRQTNINSLAQAGTPTIDNTSPTATRTTTSTSEQSLYAPSAKHRGASGDGTRVGGEGRGGGGGIKVEHEGVLLAMGGYCTLVGYEKCVLVRYVFLLFCVRTTAARRRQSDVRFSHAGGFKWCCLAVFEGRSGGWEDMQHVHRLSLVRLPFFHFSRLLKTKKTASVEFLPKFIK